MLLEKVDDQGLVRAYLGGREEALEVLVNRHQQAIFSYIMSKVKDVELANDIFQDAFIKVINTLKAGRYNEEGKFLPWVMRISHNLVIDTFRKEQRSRSQTISNRSGEFDIFDIIDNGEEDVYELQALFSDTQKVRALMDELPSEQYEVIYKRLYCDMSFKCIAEELDVSINTCLGRMRYALINLRKMIERKGVRIEVYAK